MKRYNFFRPLLIIVVAFAVNNIVTLICGGFGVDPETTEGIALAAMVLSALFVYMRLTRNRHKK
ncbi:hypothetical protein MO973_18795 [Paenibacillus sp. TRM 82003]|nr:hypothetical protein [Paenibacillus sp. TRM 82003]